MQIFREKAKLAVVWLFIFCTCAVAGMSQPKTEGLRIHLSINTTTFNKATNPTATIAIENQTESTTAMSDFQWFTVELRSASRPFESCRLDECYSASFVLGKDKIESGTTVTYNVKLSRLHWEDSISSISSGSSSNLFAAVPSGEYTFQALLSVKAENWRLDDPRYRQFKSNLITVTHAAK
jgi:hypothetical protein